MGALEVSRDQCHDPQEGQGQELTKESGSQSRVTSR